MIVEQIFADDDGCTFIHLSSGSFFNRKLNLSVIRVYKLRSDTPCTYTYVCTYASFTRSRNAFYAARTLVTFCQRSYETINLPDTKDDSDLWYCTFNTLPSINQTRPRSNGYPFVISSRISRTRHGFSDRVSRISWPYEIIGRDNG